MFKFIQGSSKECPDVQVIHKEDYNRIIIFDLINDSNNEVCTKKINVDFLATDTKFKKEQKISKAIESYIKELNT